MENCIVNNIYNYLTKNKIAVIVIIIISVGSGIYSFVPKLNSNFNKPFLSLADGTGEYSGNTLKLNFSVSNTGNSAARMINFESKAFGFPISVNEEGKELIIAPNETKLLSGTTFTKEGIRENPLLFQTKIEYYNVSDKKEKKKYCISYDLVKDPNNKQIGVKNSKLCDE